ncbi:MAG: nucleoside triphosphate pyrophosphohydrolase [Litorivicinus sp.]
MSALKQLITMMAELRDPNHGCEWDRRQTLQSLARYCIEEAYEVESAAVQQDWAQLKSELGDLWFQVIFFSQLASEQGQFDLYDVAETLHEKLVRRHPHVWPDGSRASFGQSSSASPEQIRGQWERIKQTEREAQGQAGVLADVPLQLPALERAQKLQSRAAQVGFDWPDSTGVRAKLDEELVEFDEAQTPEHRAEELGDVLFTLVNLARKEGWDAASLLRDANRKFESRFEAMEARGPIKDLTLEAWEARWQAIKH